MSLKILRCDSCKSFNLSETCSCGGISKNTLPQRYSPEDNYAKYRREAKEEERISLGLL